MMPQDVEWPRQLFGLSLLVLNKGATTKRLLRGLLDGPGPRSVCRAHPADFTTANKIQGPSLLLAPALVLLSAARNDPGARRSVTDDVRALARVPIAARLVPAAVDHPAYRLDAQVSVVPRLVAGQLRRCVVGVEAVVLRADGVVAYKGGVLDLVVDVHPVLAGPEDVVAIHHVVALGSFSEEGGDVDPVSTGP